MKRILAPILLLTFLFPSLAQGQSLNNWVGKGKGLLCETTGVGCPESVDFKDLVKREGIHYKKFSDVPFSGKTTGKYQGSLRNGRRVGLWTDYYKSGKLLAKGTFEDDKPDGLWVIYYENGQLWEKGTYKDGWRDGSWVIYKEDGTVVKGLTGTYKNGVKVK
jgi:antitoxin component YwqK of YwqJK toxin-antitoxin module